MINEKIGNLLGYGATRITGRLHSVGSYPAINPNPGVFGTATNAWWWWEVPFRNQDVNGVIIVDLAFKVYGND